MPGSSLVYNYGTIFLQQLPEVTMSSSYKLTLDTSEVSRCLLCKDPECEKACPQHIHIIDELETVRRQLLDDGQKTE